MVSPASFRVVFFGTPQFAVPTLDALLSSRHRVVAVVTQPDRPRGRGQHTFDMPIKARAVDAGIPVFQPPTLKDNLFLDTVRGLAGDIGVVAAYGKILTEAVLALPPLGLLNVHASLLPRYRGAAPVHRAVIAGDQETGVTIMRVVKALDAGPMLATVTRSIEENETSESVEGDLAKAGALLLVATLDRLLDGPVEEIAQNHAEATYAPRLTKDDGLIDWTRSARAIHNLVRGLYPWPHAYTFISGRRVIVLRADVDETASETTHPLPGTIVAARGDELRVVAGKKAVLIRDLQMEGKRAMSVREFLAGHPLHAGHRFTAQP
jgi:methionyl-tRNA formyltransferase